MLPSGTPSQFWRWIYFGVLPLFLAFSAALAITAFEDAHSAINVGSSSETSSRQSLTTLMSLSPLPERVASNFTLVDQAGKSVSLSQFRGKTVLLAFMDSRCTQVCPVEAQEFLLAEKDLGRRARDVVFVGVNVNPHANSVADVRRFTAQHGLSTLKNWYFLTGSLAQLVPVWRAYGIEVIVSKNAKQTAHSSYVYFLNPLGRERFLADANVLQRKNGTGYLPTNLVKRWGEGIARYLKLSANG
jgi:cytochrome oxidase Cu insertion factor (SCO1/SenC/PrrC family)